MEKAFKYRVVNDGAGLWRVEKHRFFIWWSTVHGAMLLARAQSKRDELNGIGKQKMP